MLCGDPVQSNSFWGASGDKCDLNDCAFVGDEPFDDLYTFGFAHDGRSRALSFLENQTLPVESLA